MKLGFVSAILDGWTFEEMMDTATGIQAFYYRSFLADDFPTG